MPDPATTKLLQALEHRLARAVDLYESAVHADDLEQAWPLVEKMGATVYETLRAVRKALA
jgi:hypothetical protein